MNNTEIGEQLYDKTYEVKFNKSKDIKTLNKYINETNSAIRNRISIAQKNGLLNVSSFAVIFLSNLGIISSSWYLPGYIKKEYTYSVSVRISSIDQYDYIRISNIVVDEIKKFQYQMNQLKEEIKAKALINEKVTVEGQKISKDIVEDIYRSIKTPPKTLFKKIDEMLLKSISKYSKVYGESGIPLIELERELNLPLRQIYENIINLIQDGKINGYINHQTTVNDIDDDILVLGATQIFHCELCKTDFNFNLKKHQCEHCQRYLCIECLKEIRYIGSENCPYCGFPLDESV